MEFDSEHSIRPSPTNANLSFSPGIRPGLSATVRKPVSPTIILVPDSDDDQPGPSTGISRRRTFRSRATNRKGQGKQSDLTRRARVEGTAKDPVVITDESSITSLEGIDHLFVNGKMDRPHTSHHAPKHRSKLEARRNRPGTASQVSVKPKRLETASSKLPSSGRTGVAISTQRTRDLLPPGVASLSASFIARKTQSSDNLTQRKSVTRIDERPPASIPPTRNPMPSTSSLPTSDVRAPSQQAPRYINESRRVTSLAEPTFEARSPERPMRVSEAGPSTITPRLVPARPTWLESPQDPEDEAPGLSPHKMGQPGTGSFDRHDSITTARRNVKDQSQSLSPVKGTTNQPLGRLASSTSVLKPQSSGRQPETAYPQRSHLSQSRSQSPVKISSTQAGLQRKGGAFGSHKKRADDGTPRIGRALSRDIREGRTPVPIPTASQESPTRPPTTRLPSSSQVPKRNSTVSVLKPRDSDPSFRTRNKSAPQAHPDRPKRARPNPGTYVIPLMDSPSWPTQRGTQPTLSQRPRAVDQSPTVRRTSINRDLESQNRRSLEKSSASSSLTSLESSDRYAAGAGTNSSSPLMQVDAENMEHLTADREMEEVEPGMRLPVEAEIIEEEEEVDLLAEWADFDFGLLGEEATEVIEPDNPQEPNEPDSTATNEGNAGASPSGTATLVASPSSNPLKRPSSSQSDAESPAKRQTRPPPVIDLEKIKLEADEMRKRHLREAEEARAERLKQEEAAMRALDEMSSQDDLCDLGDLARYRGDSITSEPEKKLPPCAQPKIKLPAPTKTSEDNPLAKLLREHRRATRKGDAGQNAEYLLRALDDEAAKSYPTPDSIDERSATNDNAELDLNAVAQDLPADMVDQDLLDEMGSHEQQDLPWTGFWLPEVSVFDGTREGAEIEWPDVAADNIFGRLILEAIRRNTPSEVSSLLTLPQTLQCVTGTPGYTEALLRWAFNKALTLQYPKDRFAASRTVIKLCPSLHGGAALRGWDLVYPLLLRFGMTPELITAPANPLVIPAHVTLQLEEACLLACEMIENSAANECAEQVVTYAQMLLLLATDGSTSPCVKMIIDRALCSIWNRLQALKTLPITIARQLELSAEKLKMPLNARAQVLLNIGRRTQFGQAVMPWFAIGCLCSGSLSEPDRVYDKVPSLDLVEEGIAIIYEAITAESPDHVAIRHLITLFSESVVNINALMDQLGPSMEKKIQEFRNMIIKAANKIQIKGFSKAKDYVNKTELSHIHVNIGQMLKLALARKERKKREAMKGMREGHGGQMRLSFGVRPDRASTRQEDGVDSDEDV